MNNVDITINKSFVYDEVAKTTSYAGSKLLGDERAYQRIFTTDDDQMMLERFWAEACNAATGLFKPFVTSVSSNPPSHGIALSNNYEVKLQLPDRYDTSLSDSVESSLFSYFVSYIVGKWYKFTNKAEADALLQEATNLLEDVKRKIYYRKKPTRVIPV